jgi:DNA invertase Pin-like site-specific DNA recombinase
MEGTRAKEHRDMSSRQIWRGSARSGRRTESAAAPRAAIYLRVSTGRQAEQDLSIPDQKKQAQAWVAQRGWSIVAEYIEPGASATDDKRPEFQRMIERACDGEYAFDVVVVHSFSRFFRDAFGLEFYVRKLAKHGVRLVSITQELGDDPAQVMMRQVIALFDEYQSKENAKHTLRSMKENARQGFWNGSRPAHVPAVSRGRQRLRPDGHQNGRELAQRAGLPYAWRRELGCRADACTADQSSLFRPAALQLGGESNWETQARKRDHL